MMVYLAWVAGKLHNRAGVPMPRSAPVFSAEVHPFIPAAIVAFYACITWEAAPLDHWVGSVIAAIQLAGWLVYSDDDDDRWRRRRRRLAAWLARRRARC